MSTDTDYRNAIILMIIAALIISIDQPVLGIMFIPFVILTITIFYNDFRSKKELNVNFCRCIVTLSLLLMFILELFLVPIQNVTFYIFLIILSVGLFLVSYFPFNPRYKLNQKEKIVNWTGSILIIVALPFLMGLIQNDFMFALIIGVFALIIILVAFFIRKRRFGKYF